MPMPLEVIAVTCSAGVYGSHLLSNPSVWCIFLCAEIKDNNPRRAGIPKKRDLTSTAGTVTTKPRKLGEM
jgi:hypothetical protein